jgi:hypothetical protein
MVTHTRSGGRPGQRFCFGIQSLQLSSACSQLYMNTIRLALPGVDSCSFSGPVSRMLVAAGKNACLEQSEQSKALTPKPNPRDKIGFPVESFQPGYRCLRGLARLWRGLSGSKGLRRAVGCMAVKGKWLGGSPKCIPTLRIMGASTLVSAVVAYLALVRRLRNGIH